MYHVVTTQISSSSPKYYVIFLLLSLCFGESNCGRLIIIVFQDNNCLNGDVGTAVNVHKSMPLCLC